MTTELGGPPLTVIDYETLDGLCEIHCTGEEIAAILDISYETLNRRLIEEGHEGFKEYFKRKSAGGKKSLRRRQMDSALDGNVPMMIWMGKQLLGQSEKSEDRTGNIEGETLKTDNKFTVEIIRAK